MQKFSHTLIRLMVVIALSISLFTLGYHTALKLENPGPLQTSPKVATVSVMVDAGDTIHTFTDVPYQDNETVFELLESLASTSAIQLSSKDYGGDLGVFIESIGGVGLGDKNKWWQFWVNNTYSTKGASFYTLREGDVVTFKFTGNQQ